MSRAAPYFANHDRRQRFPWSLYHRELNKRIVEIVAAAGPRPRVLVVGCGLEPYVRGGPSGAVYWGCDLDPTAIEACASRYPALAGRLGVCRDELSLPESPEFPSTFDIVLAKEVVEHLDEPAPWSQVLARRVGAGGSLVLSTPNYGRWSSLPLIERTVLEWIARRDGYSRRHIHPSKFDRARLAALDVGPGMALVRVHRALTGWTLVGHWRRMS